MQIHSGVEHDNSHSVMVEVGMTVCHSVESCREGECTDQRAAETTEGSDGPGEGRDKPRIWSKRIYSG